MTDARLKMPSHGYVSPYLENVPRTLNEAKKQHEPKRGLPAAAEMKARSNFADHRIRYRILRATDDQTNRPFSRVGSRLWH